MLDINGIEWLHKVDAVAESPAKTPVLVLEFCRQGHIEWAGGVHPCNHLEVGEMLVYDAWTYGGLIRSKDYSGDRILFYSEAAASISENFKSFEIDFEGLCKKFGNPSRPFIVHTREEVGRVFSRINGRAGTLQMDYCMLGLLELLVSLKNLDTHRESICRECNLSSLQVEKVYGIRSFICENMDCHFTIEELSDKFDMPATAMKLCFKNVFGLPVFTYARRERMKVAAKQLREGDRGILEIAGSVGYNNGSKFAHAFQDVMGMTPKEYRKRYRQMNVA